MNMPAETQSQRKCTNICSIHRFLCVFAPSILNFSLVLCEPKLLNRPSTPNSFCSNTNAWWPPPSLPNWAEACWKKKNEQSMRKAKCYVYYNILIYEASWCASNFCLVRKTNSPFDNNMKFVWHNINSVFSFWHLWTCFNILVKPKKHFNMRHVSYLCAGTTTTEALHYMSLQCIIVLRWLNDYIDFDGSDIFFAILLVVCQTTSYILVCKFVAAAQLMHHHDWAQTILQHATGLPLKPPVRRKNRKNTTKKKKKEAIDPETIQPIEITCWSCKKYFPH